MPERYISRAAFSTDRRFEKTNRPMRAYVPYVMTEFTSVSRDVPTPQRYSYFLPVFAAPFWNFAR